MSWQDKHQRALALVAQAKNITISSAEDAERFSRLTNDARRLMNEVREDRLVEEKGRKADILAQFDRDLVGDTGRHVATVGADQTSGASPYDGHGAVKLSSSYVVSHDPSGRINRGLQEAAFVKALNEGAMGAGLALVPPQYLQDLFAESRRQGNALRRYGMLAEHPVSSNQVLLPRGAGAATVGIVSEGTTKPSADQSYTQVTINIFTWAGISKVSRQLMEDSSPTAADLVNRELGSLLGNLEEQKIINGSGTGEPRGFLNTTGVNSVTSSTGATAQSIIDNTLDGIVAIQTAYFAPPTAMLMHPRRWGYLAKGKDTATNYLINNPGVFRAPADWPSGVTSVSTGGSQSMPSLFGLPVALSANIPTNLGGGTNQDCIIVGDFSQAHWFQRTDVAMDVSDQAGTAFEQNQVWFRLEERAGFSAERYPAAFAVLQGTNLSSANV